MASDESGEEVKKTKTSKRQIFVVFFLILLIVGLGTALGIVINMQLDVKPPPLARYVHI
jgi:hypothetical protein